MEIVKMRFSILNTFHQISHTFDFFGMTLTSLVTLTFDLRSPKKICTIPGVCLTFVPKMKLIRPLVSEEFCDRHTDTQRTYGYYSID